MGTFLTVCIADDTDDVTDALKQLSKRGMVSNVVICAIDDLIDQGANARCVHLDESECTDTFLATTLQRQPHETRITLASLRLRAPRANDGATLESWQEYLERETNCGRLIRGMVRSGVQFRSLTVSILRDGMPMETFSSWWDVHLIHDRYALDLPTTPERVSEEDCAAACAFVALCVGGGWTISSDRGFRTPREEGLFEGEYGAVQIVRPEIRVVAAVGLDQRLDVVTAGAFPERQPWPAPTNISTIHRPSDIAPDSDLVEKLAHVCGFMVDPPRFEGTLTLDKWRSGRAALKWSFGRVNGDPADVLRQWEESVLTHDIEATDPLPVLDSREGFVVGNLDEALERFGYYMDDIDAVASAASKLHSKLWMLFDYETAVLALRDARMPGLTLGIVNQKSRWPACWSDMRRYFFALLDGSRLPDELDWEHIEYSSGTEVPYWSDPSVVAPDLEEDVSHAFDLDAGLATVLGMPRISPADSMAWKRADSHIRGEVDTFFDQMYDPEALDGGVRKSWESWNRRAERTPMAQLARHLGNAVDEAYHRLAENSTPPDDDGSEDELLHELTSRRAIRLVSVPMTVALPVIAIVLGLAGWLYLGTTWIPIVMVVVGLLWMLAVMSICGASWKLVNTTQRYAYVVSRRWRWAMEMRHYAVELTRLHGVARAFDDHRSIICKIVHEPFPRSDQQQMPEHRFDVEDALPRPLLLASASVDERRWEQRHKEMRNRIMRAGWLGRSYDQVEATWKAEFSALLDDQAFSDPDDDYNPPGETPFRSFVTDEAVPGPREHFRDAVVDGMALRVAARLRTAMELAEVAEGHEAELLTKIHVDGYPALSGSALEFLQFENTEVLGFDPTMAREGSDTFSVSEARSLGMVPTPVRLDHWGSGGSEVAFASMRMLVSAPREPRDLDGVVFEPVAVIEHDREDDSYKGIF